MVDRSDAFDVIIDEETLNRTSFLKRAFALRLAAQNVYDEWYSYPDPSELAAALKDKSFEPSEVMTKLLLAYSGSIEAKTLDILRDVGVGSPQIGIAGVGNPTPQIAQNQPAEQPSRRRVFK